MLPIRAPYQQYFDLDGSPLNGGYLYFGTVNLNPETNPITVYWDAAGTQPATNIRTSNGVIVRSGTPADVYVAGSYSITVRNSKQQLVRTAMDASEFDANIALNAAVVSLQAAIANTVISGRAGVLGLVGNVNAGTPLTKFDLNAYAVSLRNAAGAVITEYPAGAITCDLGAAGSVANGRDQSGVFTGSQWIYLYFISNGTTLATIASTTSPALFTGASLPVGYTYWAFATAIRWNASANIIPVLAEGSKVFYDLANSQQRVLTNGVATSMTAVSCASFVPPVALSALLSWIIQLTHNAAGVEFGALYRKTGSSSVGSYAVEAYSQVAALIIGSSGRVETPLDASSKFDYKITNAPSTSGGVIVDVLGYSVPNGDSL